MNSPTSPHYHDLSAGKSNTPQTSASIASHLNLPHSKTDRLPFETDQTALSTDQVNGPNSLSVTRSVLVSSELTHESDGINPLDSSDRISTAATHASSTTPDTFSAPTTPKKNEQFPSSSALSSGGLDYMQSISIFSAGVPPYETSTEDALFTGLAGEKTNVDAVIMLRSSLITPQASSGPLDPSTEASLATLPTGSGRQILQESSRPENSLTQSSRLDDADSSSFFGRSGSYSGQQYVSTTYWTDVWQSSGTVDAIRIGSTALSTPTSSIHPSGTADGSGGSRGISKQSIGATLGSVSGAGVIAACIVLVRRLFFTHPKVQGAPEKYGSDGACRGSLRTEAVAPEISRFSADS